MPNLYKIKLIITSLIEMLQLANFGLIITFTIKFWLSDKILILTSYISLFRNNFIARRPRVHNFADIKIVTAYIKRIQKDSKKV